MNDSTVEKYQVFLSKILNCATNEVNINITFKNYPKWDSFAHVEVMVALDELFSIEFTEENFVKYGNAAEISNLFNEQ